MDADVGLLVYWYWTVGPQSTIHNASNDIIDSQLNSKDDDDNDDD